MLIIQFHTSNLWKNASHTISKNQWKKIRTKFCGYVIQSIQSVDNKKTTFFLEENVYHTISIYDKLLVINFHVYHRDIVQFLYV